MTPAVHQTSRNLLREVLRDVAWDAIPDSAGATAESGGETSLERGFLLDATRRLDPADTSDADALPTLPAQPGDPHIITVPTPVVSPFSRELPRARRPVRGHGGTGEHPDRPRHRRASSGGISSGGRMRESLVTGGGVA